LSNFFSQENIEFLEVPLFTMLMFAAAATGTTFTSCSKDDDPQAPEPEKEPKYELATGKSWILSQVKQGDGDYGEGSGNLLTFKSDGTFESTDPIFSTFAEGTKYSYDKENTITIKGKDKESEKEVTITITIVSLTADAFEIQVKIKGRDPMDPNFEQNVSYKGGMR